MADKKKEKRIKIKLAKDVKTKDGKTFRAGQRLITTDDELKQRGFPADAVIILDDNVQD